MLETAVDRGVTAHIYGDTAAKQPTGDLSMSSNVGINGTKKDS